MFGYASYDRMSNAGVLAKCNTDVIETFLMQSPLYWDGHVARMSENRTNVVMYSQLASRQRDI